MSLLTTIIAPPLIKIAFKGEKTEEKPPPSKVYPQLWGEKSWTRESNFRVRPRYAALTGMINSYFSYSRDFLKLTPFYLKSIIKFARDEEIFCQKNNEFHFQKIFEQRDGGRKTKTKMSRGAGIGRQASLRSLCPVGRTGSSPVLGTNKEKSNFVGGTAFGKWKIFIL